MKKLLSVLLAAAMLLSLTPAVIAEDAAARIPIWYTDPEFVFYAVNDFEGDEVGSIYSEAYYIPATDGEGNPITVDMLFNDDMTLTDYAKVYFERTLSESVGIYEDFFPGLLDGISAPNDFLGMFAVISEINYRVIKTVLEITAAEDTAGETYLADFLAKYPDSKVLNDEAFAAYFGEINTYTFDELLYFSAGNSVTVGEDNVINKLTYDIAYDEKTGEPLYVNDVITPTGAYLEPRENLGGYRNVYVQLKDAYAAGDIDAYEAFAIITGYMANGNGDLYTFLPFFDYAFCENGDLTYEIADVVNEDGTVLDSGLSVFDYAVNNTFDTYKNAKGTMTDAYPTVPTGGTEAPYNTVMTGILGKYLMMDVATEDVTMTDEELLQYVTEEITYDIEWMKESGYSDEDITVSLLYAYCGFNHDFFGYVTKGQEFSYITDAETGKFVNIETIMDAEGHFVTEEYGVATVWELFEEYLDTVDVNALLKGDCNNDGKINLNDITVILKYIAKWDVDIANEAADVNGDGRVNINDITLMLKCVAGWDVRYVY